MGVIQGFSQAVTRPPSISDRPVTPHNGQSKAPSKSMEGAGLFMDIERGWVPYTKVEAGIMPVTFSKVTVNALSVVVIVVSMVLPLMIRSIKLTPLGS